MLLAVQAGIHHYYGVNFWQHCAEGFLSPVSYIAGFNILETMVLSATHGCYISKDAVFFVKNISIYVLTNSISTFQ